MSPFIVFDHVKLEEIYCINEHISKVTYSWMQHDQSISLLWFLLDSYLDIKL
jgi:hypothetical protein